MKIDPIRYEMFVHRLMNIAEEGRIALQKVCASPIVVQGGECMASFYEADGTTILSASGHLRFSAGLRGRGQEAHRVLLRESRESTTATSST